MLLLKLTMKKIIRIIKSLWRWWRGGLEPLEPVAAKIDNEQEEVMSEAKGLKFKELTARIAQRDCGKGKKELNITEIGRILRVLKDECQKDKEFSNGLFRYLGARIVKK